MRSCFTASSRNMPELPTVLQCARACERLRVGGKPTQFWNEFIALAHVTTYTRLIGGPGNEATEVLAASFMLSS